MGPQSLFDRYQLHFLVNTYEFVLYHPSANEFASPVEEIIVLGS